MLIVEFGSRCKSTGLSFLVGQLKFKKKISHKAIMWTSHKVIFIECKIGPGTSYAMCEWTLLILTEFPHITSNFNGLYLSLTEQIIYLICLPSHQISFNCDIFISNVKNQRLFTPSSSKSVINRGICMSLILHIVRLFLSQGNLISRFLSLRFPLIFIFI